MQRQCVRECEELFKIFQRNRDLRLDFVGVSRLQAARMMHTCQACQKLKSRASYCTTGQKFETGQAICSRLELATQPSREVKSPEHPVWEKQTFHIPSHLTIYILLYPRFRGSFQREFLREKPQRKTRLTHPQSLPKRLFKFLYSLLLHCQILERVIIKTFSHHIHFCERVVWCFGKQLGRNQFHID